MYFEEIFEAIQLEMPGTEFDVDKEFPAAAYPDLNLTPVLHSVKVPLGGSRQVGGVAYEPRTLRLPSPRSIWNSLRRPRDLQVAVEFSPVSTVSVITAWLRRVPVVILLESDPSFRGANASVLNTLRKRLLVRLASRVVAGSPHAADYAVRTLHVPYEKVARTPYITSYPRNGSEIELTREREVELLFVNSLTARKGVFQMLEAIALLTPNVRHQIHLSIVGDGLARPEIESRVVELGLSDVVTLEGRRPYRELGPFYARADMVLVPALADYRSLAGFEAVNWGKPVVVSKHDGASRELRELGASIIVVDPLDPAALSAPIQRFVADAEYRTSVSTLASSYIGVYAPSVIVKPLTAVLESTARGSRRRPR